MQNAGKLQLFESKRGTVALTLNVDVITHFKLLAYELLKTGQIFYSATVGVVFKSYLIEKTVTI